MDYIQPPSKGQVITAEFLKRHSESVRRLNTMSSDSTAAGGGPGGIKSFNKYISHTRWMGIIVDEGPDEGSGPESPEVADEKNFLFTPRYWVQRLKDTSVTLPNPFPDATESEKFLALSVDDLYDGDIKRAINLAECYWPSQIGAPGEVAAVRAISLVGTHMLPTGTVVEVTELATDDTTPLHVFSLQPKSFAFGEILAYQPGWPYNYQDERYYVAIYDTEDDASFTAGDAATWNKLSTSGTMKRIVTASNISEIGQSSHGVPIGTYVLIVKLPLQVFSSMFHQSRTTIDEGLNESAEGGCRYVFTYAVSYGVRWAKITAAPNIGVGYTAVSANSISDRLGSNEGDPVADLYIFYGGGNHRPALEVGDAVMYHTDANGEHIIDHSTITQWTYYSAGP